MCPSSIRSSNIGSSIIILLNKEKRRLEESRKNNKRFLEYIDQMKLVISIDEKEYLLRHDMIVSSEDTTSLVDARLQVVIRNIKNKQYELTKLQLDLDDRFKSDDDNKLIKSLSIMPASELNVDISKIKSMKQLTENAIATIQKRIDEVATDETIIKTIEECIRNNIRAMDLDPDILFKDVDKICMMHKELKQYAGTYLLLIVLAFRLSYLSTISQELGINLPLIIDSPCNGELDSSNIARIIKVLNEYGKNHQIIIASINSLDGLHISNKVTLDSLEKLIDTPIDSSFFN